MRRVFAMDPLVAEHCEVIERLYCHLALRHVTLMCLLMYFSCTGFNQEPAIQLGVHMGQQDLALESVFVVGKTMRTSRGANMRMK